MEFSSKFIEIEGKKIELRLWDIAGQDHYVGMSRVYFNGALGAIVMCDVTNKQSIENATKWKDIIDDRVFFHDQKIPVLLIGNKTDLLKDDKKKEVEDMLNNIAKTEDFKATLMASALLGVNINESMQKIAELILEKFGTILENGESEQSNNDVDLTYVPQTTKKGCCE